VNNKNEILNELKTLAPSLAGIAKQNCFTIPKNYFLQGMPKVSAVADILEEQATKIQNDFMYLDLMSEILADNFADIANVEVFKVPKNYFETLTENVVAYKKAKLAIEPNVEGAVALDASFQTNKYAVPENYFDELSQNILAKVIVADVSAFEKAVETQLNETVFTLPNNYFDKLPQSILNKIKTPEKSAKIIFLQKVRNVLAIAATLALFVAGAWFLNLDKTDATNTQSINQQIAQLSTEEVKAYIASNAYLFESEILAEDLMEEDNKNLFWQMDLNADELDYYLQNIEEYNLNI